MEPGLLEAFRPCPRRFPDPAPHPQGERALLSRRDPLERRGAGRAAPGGRGLREETPLQPGARAAQPGSSTGPAVRTPSDAPRAGRVIAPSRLVRRSSITPAL